jgi:hypothetical protein
METGKARRAHDPARVLPEAESTCTVRLARPPAPTIVEATAAPPEFVVPLMSQ